MKTGRFAPIFASQKVDSSQPKVNSPERKLRSHWRLSVFHFVYFLVSVEVVTGRFANQELLRQHMQMSWISSYIAILTVTSHIVINVPTRGSLAVEIKGSFLLWSAKFTSKYQNNCLSTLSIAICQFVNVCKMSEMYFSNSLIIINNYSPKWR